MSQQAAGAAPTCARISYHRGLSDCRCTSSFRVCTASPNSRLAYDTAARSCTAV